MKTISVIVILLCTAFGCYSPVLAPEHVADAVKEIYLTFDDGPCAYTEKILDILKSNGVRATFFVVGIEAEKHPDIIKRICREGHTLGAHCYTHDYKVIYKSPQSFVDDVTKCLDTLKKIVPGYNVSIMRFAGGSFGLSEKYKVLPKTLRLRYVDWNASNGDTEGKGLDGAGAVAYAISTAREGNNIIMLMHDNKMVTVNSLNGIIAHFKSGGYTFLAL